MVALMPECRCGKLLSISSSLLPCSYTNSFFSIAKLNCTLVAIKEVLSSSDESIFDAFKANGYQENEGFEIDRWIQSAKDLGLRLKSVSTISEESDRPYGKPKRMTLARVRDTFTRGTYLVWVQEHVLVLRDGILVDHNADISKAFKTSTNSRVLGLWKVMNPGGK